MNIIEKIEKHKIICEELNQIYEIKNERYNDAFSKSFDEYGLTMSCIRLEDKLHRLKALSKNKELDNQKDESMKDTLKDLANYAIMALIELNKE